MGAMANSELVRKGGKEENQEDDGEEKQEDAGEEEDGGCFCKPCPGRCYLNVIVQ